MFVHSNIHWLYQTFRILSGMFKYWYNNKINTKAKYKLLIYTCSYRNLIDMWRLELVIKAYSEYKLAGFIVPVPSQKGSCTIKRLVQRRVWYNEGSGTTKGLVQRRVWYNEGSGTTKGLVQWRVWYNEGSSITKGLVQRRVWYNEGSSITKGLVQWRSGTLVQWRSWPWPARLMNKLLTQTYKCLFDIQCSLLCRFLGGMYHTSIM